MMVINSNIGTVKCSDFSEYEKAIKEHLMVENEIWCYEDGVKYPCIAILKKSNLSVVNYFSENNTLMFSSVGDVSKKGIIKFLNEKYEVAQYQIISSDMALKCALQFFYNQERPSCIDWEEL